jgi:hypothetical protein
LLAHNEWDPAARRPVPKIIYSFGREDQLDKEAIGRLVASLSRLLEPGGALAAAADSGLAPALWWRARARRAVAAAGDREDRGRARLLGAGRPRDAAAAERVLFGLVASRALAASSKLAASQRPRIHGR